MTLLILIKKTWTTIAAAVLAAAAIGLGTMPAGAVSGFACQEVTRAVALGPGLPADQTASGTLCMPNHFIGPATIDILVHGATYNRTYWDFPVNQPQYSYVNRTLNAGRATFAYDRLGTGQSSKPLSTLVTIGSDAYILHQLVGWARSDLGFAKVDLVGHSFGSIVSVNETATYNDADRLVLTGFLHAVTPGATQTAGGIYPAFLDPQFSGLGLDPGWLTSVPGVRGTFFYSSIADPAVIAYDEAHKDIASATQFGDGLAQSNAPAAVNISQGVRIPVMEIVGTQDFLFCVGGNVDCNDTSAALANEQPYFTNAPSLSYARVQATGHDLTLHPTATTSFVTINSWITTH